MLTRSTPKRSSRQLIHDSRSHQSRSRDRGSGESSAGSSTSTCSRESTSSTSSSSSSPFSPRQSLVRVRTEARKTSQGRSAAPASATFSSFSSSSSSTARLAGFDSPSRPKKKLLSTRGVAGNGNANLHANGEGRGGAGGCTQKKIDNEACGSSGSTSSKVVSHGNSSKDQDEAGSPRPVPAIMRGYDQQKAATASTQKKNTESCRSNTQATFFTLLPRDEKPVSTVLEDDGGDDHDVNHRSRPGMEKEDEVLPFLDQLFRDDGGLHLQSRRGARARKKKTRRSSTLPDESLSSYLSRGEDEGDESSGSPVQRPALVGATHSRMQVPRQHQQPTVGTRTPRPGLETVTDTPTTRGRHKTRSKFKPWKNLHREKSATTASHNTATTKAATTDDLPLAPDDLAARAEPDAAAAGVCGAGRTMLTGSCSLDEDSDSHSERASLRSRTKVKTDAAVATKSEERVTGGGGAMKAEGAASKILPVPTKKEEKPPVPKPKALLHQQLEASSSSSAGRTGDADHGAGRADKSSSKLLTPDLPDEGRIIRTKRRGAREQHPHDADTAFPRESLETCLQKLALGGQNAEPDELRMQSSALHPATNFCQRPFIRASDTISAGGTFNSPYAYNSFGYGSSLWERYPFLPQSAHGQHFARQRKKERLRANQNRLYEEDPEYLEKYKCWIEDKQELVYAEEQSPTSGVRHLKRHVQPYLCAKLINREGEKEELQKMRREEKKLQEFFAGEFAAKQKLDNKEERQTRAPIRAANDARGVKRDKKNHSNSDDENSEYSHSQNSEKKQNRGITFQLPGRKSTTPKPTSTQLGTTSARTVKTLSEKDRKAAKERRRREKLEKKPPAALSAGHYFKPMPFKNRTHWTGLSEADRTAVKSAIIRGVHRLAPHLPQGWNRGEQRPHSVHKVCETIGDKQCRMLAWDLLRMAKVAGHKRVKGRKLPNSAATERSWKFQTLLPPHEHQYSPAQFDEFGCITQGECLRATRDEIMWQDDGMVVVGLSAPVSKDKTTTKESYFDDHVFRDAKFIGGGEHGYKKGLIPGSLREKTAEEGYGVRKMLLPMGNFLRNHRLKALSDSRNADFLLFRVDQHALVELAWGLDEEDNNCDQPPPPENITCDFPIGGAESAVRKCLSWLGHFVELLNYNDVLHYGAGVEIFERQHQKWKPANPLQTEWKKIPIWLVSCRDANREPHKRVANNVEALLGALQCLFQERPEPEVAGFYSPSLDRFESKSKSGRSSLESISQSLQRLVVLLLLDKIFTRFHDGTLQLEPCTKEEMEKNELCQNVYMRRKWLDHFGANTSEDCDRKPFVDMVARCFRLQVGADWWGRPLHVVEEWLASTENVSCAPPKSEVKEDHGSSCLLAKERTPLLQEEGKSGCGLVEEGLGRGGLATAGVASKAATSYNHKPLATTTAESARKSL
ncbi:unnamed protein product [Amoebophrya sp. A120]|nr:unnamed protein product [Amoebophrya sp. A120]|eukprot:GSA120T00007589001.1